MGQKGFYNWFLIQIYGESLLIWTDHLDERPNRFSYTGNFNVKITPFVLWAVEVFQLLLKTMVKGCKGKEAIGKRAEGCNDQVRKV